MPGKYFEDTELGAAHGFYNDDKDSGVQALLNQYGSANRSPYEEQLRKTLDVIGPQQQFDRFHPKATSGAEGQLWQGIGYQQNAMAANANRRGFDPSQARAASYAGAQMEGQGWAAANALRAQQEAQRRAMVMQAMQARSGIEGELGQQDLSGWLRDYQKRTADAQLAYGMKAAKDQSDAAILAGGINSVKSLGTGGMMSDRRAKEDAYMAGRIDQDRAIRQMRESEFAGGGRALSGDRLLSTITPLVPWAAPVTDAMRMIGHAREQNASQNSGPLRTLRPLPIPAGQYQPAPIQTEMLSRVDADGHQQLPPAPVQAVAPAVAPVRPTIPAIVGASNSPAAVSDQRAKERAFMAGAAQGQDGLLRQMAQLGGRGIGAGSWGAAPNPAADYRAAQFAAGLQQAGMRTDAALRGGDGFDGLIRQSKGQMWRYKPEFQQGLGLPPGQHFGPMAQDLEKDPIGRTMVRDTPTGKVVDVPMATMANMGMIGRLGERLDRLEGKAGAKSGPTRPMVYRGMEHEGEGLESMDGGFSRPLYRAPAGPHFRDSKAARELLSDPESMKAIDFSSLKQPVYL